MNQDRHLILISLGPVQEFIASSRKLRDLWCGSHLLSELSKTVARTLAEAECELVFPAPETQAELEAGSELSVANKVLAVTAPGALPSDLARRAEDAFRLHLQNEAERIVKTLPDSVLDVKRFRAQLDDFGEFYAAWVGLGDKETDYGHARQRAEELLSGRKTLRDFRKPGWEGTGVPKNSLDGARETVLLEGRSLRKRFALKAGEQLDTPGMLKRFGEKGRVPHFESLSDQAIIPYLRGLEKDEDLRPCLERVRAAASANSLSALLGHLPNPLRVDILGNLPAEFLFPGRLEDFIQENELRESMEVTELMASLGNLVRKSTIPQPYAVILVGDGDRMGEVIDRIGTKEEHKLFTRFLSRFALSVRSVIENHDGKLIYSGGDDVMAYLPLHTALEAAVEIRRTFAESLRPICEKMGVPCPTFSAGMTIVHHLEPLDEALGLARKAEKISKVEGGRDALAVIQSKRSGSDLIICGKWEGPSGLPERLMTMRDMYEQDLLPSRLGYQIRTAAMVCGAEARWRKEGEDVKPANPAAAEAWRLMNRKKIREAGRLAKIFEATGNLGILSGELVIAHQFSNARRMAKGMWSVQEEE